MKKGRMKKTKKTRKKSRVIKSRKKKINLE